MDLHLHISKSVVSTLAAVLFAIKGVVALMVPLWFVAIGAEGTALTIVSVVCAIFGAAYILAAYGLYRGYRWGWLLAILLVTLNTICALGELLLLGLTPALIPLTINLALLVLLLFTAREYLTSPTTATPAPAPAGAGTPTSPLAHMAFVRVKADKKFVRKRR